MPSGYDPSLFSAMFDAEDRHFWFRARNLALRAVLETLVDHRTERYRMLESGCGTGNTLRVLRQSAPRRAILVGMDLFEEGLQYARSRTPVPLVQGRIEQAPFSVPFDLLGMFDVLEHIEDDVSTLERLRTLIALRGVLILTVPAHKDLWSRFDEESHHYRRYEPDELQHRLVTAGFTVEYLTPFMASLYPVLKVARWFTRGTDAVRRRFNVPKRSAVLNELKVRFFVNELVAFLLSQEAPLLSRRRQLPMGTSLLAVARVS